MIALDTNVLVRYLVQDDPDQSFRASQILEDLSESNRAFVSCVVLCETFWVLKTSYQLPKEALVNVLDRLFYVPVLDIEHLGSCLLALQAYTTGRADFSDYLIKSIAAHYGYPRVFTFDKTASQSEGFVLL